MFRSGTRGVFGSIRTYGMGVHDVRCTQTRHIDLEPIVIFLAALESNAYQKGQLVCLMFGSQTSESWQFFQVEFVAFSFAVTIP